MFAMIALMVNPFGLYYDCNCCNHYCYVRSLLAVTGLILVVTAVLANPVSSIADSHGFYHDDERHH